MLVNLHREAVVHLNIERRFYSSNLFLVLIKSFKYYINNSHVLWSYTLFEQKCSIEACYYLNL